PRGMHTGRDKSRPYEGPALSCGRGNGSSQGGSMSSAQGRCRIVRTVSAAAGAALALMPILYFASSLALAENWPAFRGADGRAVLLRLLRQRAVAPRPRQAASHVRQRHLPCDRRRPGGAEFRPRQGGAPRRREQADGRNRLGGAAAEGGRERENDVRPANRRSRHDGPDVPRGG